jgi:hypothetical protein
MFTPTRQHEGMDVKRLGNVAHGDARQLTQTDSSCLEFLGVTEGGSWAWLGHLVDT